MSNQPEIDNQRYQATTPADAVKLLLECYVYGHGYKVVAPQVFGGAVFSIYHEDTDKMLVVADDGNIIKSNCIYTDMGHLTNGEIDIAKANQVAQPV